jgi:lysozyme family protein
MSARFDYCMDIVFGNEGGVSNDPNDNGGLTNLGVTQTSYDSYRRKMGLPLQPVTYCTKAEASDLYAQFYWATIYGDKMPVPVDLCMFDTSVNSGPGRSMMILQQAMSITADGVYGPATAARISMFPPTQLAGLHCDARELYVRGIVENNATQAKFLNGWLNRINHIRALCQVTD